MVEKILNNTTPYGKNRASHEGSLHSSTLRPLYKTVYIASINSYSFSGHDINARIIVHLLTSQAITYHRPLHRAILTL